MQTTTPDQPAGIAADKPALEPLLVGPKDLGRILAISVATLWRWDASGQLGPLGVKKGGKRLWVLAEIRAWVATGMPDRQRWLALTRADGRGEG